MYPSRTMLVLLASLSVPRVALGQFNSPAFRTQDATERTPDALVTSARRIPDEVAIGTAHPIIFLDADPMGRWLAICQARRDTNGDGHIESSSGIHGGVFGDQMRAYFALGGGDGTAIDDWIGSSPDGRWVAFVERRHVKLADAETGAVVDLGRHGLDPHAWSGALSPSPWGNFDDTGTWFLSRTHARGQTTLHLRNLATGATTDAELGDKRVFHAYVGPSGSWVHVATLADGVERGPHVQTTRDGGLCVRPAAFSTYGMRGGPRPDEWIAPTSNPGALVPAGEVIAETRSFLVRAENGAWVATQGDGTVATWLPNAADCRVAGIERAADRLLIACGAEDGAELSLTVLGPEGSRDVARVGTSRVARYGVVEGRIACPVDDRLSSYMRGATTAPICVDLETATLVHIPFEVDSVVATSGPRVYFIANSGLYVLPREGEAPRYIAHDVSDRGVRTGRFMAVGPLMIDLEMERIVGAFDGDPMFLTEDGRMLTQLHAPALARTRVADTDEVEEESGFDFESMDGMPIEMGPVTFRSALGVGAAGR